MSALGQKRTFCNAGAMSALPPKADMCSATGACPLCANSGHQRSKQYLIRSPRRRWRAAPWRHREAKCLGGLEVDHKFVLCRRLHWQVCRLLALEDAIDVTCRASVHGRPIRPIGDQAAGGDEEAIEVDRGQLVPCRKRDDQIAMSDAGTRSPSRSDRHSVLARKPRRRARSRRRRAC